ncbi:hypothetical protein E4U54_004038 [Claviceps lovelessii]|nr:hypothetical protein E4U54_004038 [Claviceps lovelessii]
MNNTTNPDILRKVGRGGAGNFYSVKKQDELAAEKDLERQDNLARPLVVPPADASSSLRGGRGGAGNFVDPAQVPAAQEEERNTAHEVSEAVLTANRKRHSCNHTNRMGGRGGAGNWAGKEGGEDGAAADDDDDDADVEAGLSRTGELEEKVVEAVEKGLKIPEKVHHGREKDAKP